MSQPAVPQATVPAPQPTQPSRRAPALIGLALIVPAVIAWVWSYVLPTLSTVARSFEGDGLRRPYESAGVRNYEVAFTSGFVGQVGFAVLLSLIPLAVALLAAPLLAVLADRAGRVARLVTRGVLALPLAAYAPVAVYLGRRAENIESGTYTENLQSPRTFLVSALAQVTFGLVVAVAATLYLSALRRREPDQRPAPAMLAVGGLLGLGVLAAGLQTFTAPYILTGGGPRGDYTATPVFSIAQTSFRTLRLGVGSATSTLLLVLLGLLGLAAVALILATRLRIEFDGWRDRPAVREAESYSGRRPLLVGLTAVALVVVIGVTVWASSPWLRNLSSDTGPLPRGVETSNLFANTWVPPLLSTLVAVGLAALAGFGIGALRPLGRWSELLLVPFAPWLFVGAGPLAIANFERTMEREQLGLFLGLVPPTWLSVPALFAFTLLFRGQHERWRSGGGVGRTLLLPALPMLAVTALPTWLAHAQSPLWTTLVGKGPDSLTAPVLVQMVASRAFGAGGELPLGLILPLPMLILFVVLFVALMVGYVDRLAIRVGRRSGADAPPAGAGGPVGKVTA
ncbi:sugar ABC transporter permease [Micromonospora echinospora]|uniref:ABC-type sugar transport system permease subunit n=1 Tax=Micromonospora echinospora TaxID=1877 RepID=A0ABR6MFN2_MICEC|nr:sugar ABC transporter permease [Micromonospora echinospora]MBB5114198.1 ABC-type sugar transport system permease subunit [Micromonospora echinospora]